MSAEQQQYRVHACNNAETHEAHEFRGTYRKPSLPGVEITETFQCEGIEPPVPTADEPRWQVERDRTLVARLRDDHGPVRERMTEAADRIERLEAVAQPSLPTREQIAAAIYGGIHDWSELSEWNQKAYLTRAEAVLALLSRD